MMKIKVKRGDKEIEVEMPLSERQTVTMDSKSSPRGILDMVKELVEQMNNIK